MKPTTRRAIHAAVWLLGVALIASALAGCGGGDPEPDDQQADTLPVNCQQQPERCK
jgi:hypothetical protein